MEKHSELINSFTTWESGENREGCAAVRNSCCAAITCDGGGEARKCVG